MFNTLDRSKNSLWIRQWPNHSEFKIQKYLLILPVKLFFFGVAFSADIIISEISE